MAVSTEVPRPSRRTMIQSVAPGGIFLVANALVGVTIGVILASLASLAVIAVRRATGSPIGLVLPVTVGYVMVRGVAGASGSMTTSKLALPRKFLRQSAIVAVWRKNFGETRKS